MYTKTMEKKVGKAKEEAGASRGKKFPDKIFSLPQRSSHCEDQNKGTGKG